MDSCKAARSPQGAHLAGSILGQVKGLVPIGLRRRGCLFQARLADLVVLATVNTGLGGTRHALVVGCVPAGDDAVARHRAVLRRVG